MEEVSGKKKLCKKCRTEIDVKAKVCPQCRSKQGGKGLLIISMIILGFIFIGALGSEGNDNENLEGDKVSLEAEESINSDTEEKKDTSEETQDPLLLDWNKTEIDVMSNGNIQIAVEALSSNSFSESEAIEQEAEKVIKTPWEYYGKFMKFTGIVAVVQDFPPGSDTSIALNTDTSTDVVIETDDGTIVELFGSISSGNVKVGDQVTIYGYPVGTADVENKMGGFFTHLIIVGNSIT